MTSDQSSADSEETRFLAELRQLIDATGLSHAKLAKQSKIPTSTLSDILSGKRTRPLNKAVLEALLEACDLSPAEIGNWETRRVRLVQRYRYSDQEQPDGEIEALQVKLDQATLSIERMRAREEDLRARLRRADEERVGLVAQLAAERSKNDRSDVIMAELQGQITRLEGLADQLRSKLSSAIAQVQRAETQAVNVRAELAQVEAEALFDQNRAMRRQFATGWDKPAGNQHGSTVGVVNSRLAQHIVWTTEVQQLVNAGLTKMQEVRKELADTVDGASAAKGDVMVGLIDQACDELAFARRFTDEIIDRANGLLGIGGQVTALGEDIRRCADGVVIALGILTDCKYAVQSLAYSHVEYESLIPVVLSVEERLQQYQIVSSAAVQTIDEYSRTL